MAGDGTSLPVGEGAAEMAPEMAPSLKDRDPRHFDRYESLLLLNHSGIFDHPTFLKEQQA
jgi:hypothetical protein